MYARTLLPLFLSLGACSWVGDKDFEARLLEIDDDADGSPAAEDCDDHNAAVSPATPEIYYDGVDGDCGGGDDFDQDNDGYVPNEHVGKATDGVAGTGSLPAGDCDDEEPLASPQQPEVWYTGVDQNCDGLDDYDQDQDGFVPAEFVGLVTEYVAGSGALPGGDCDDVLTSVGPSNADTWYDGIDTDCAGNDDWDADGDGFIPDAYFPDYGPTQYVDGSGLLDNGDCDDDDASVYPDAPGDTWYDDVDTDCAGNDDFDQDVDGFALNDADFPDCDDTEPATYPGAVETLDDSQDSDCDGGVDSFLVTSFSDVTWSEPHSPVFGASASRVYLSLATSEITSGSTHYYDSGVALYWTLSEPTASRGGITAWNSYTSDQSDFVLGAGQGFIVTDDYIYGALNLDYGDDRVIRIVRYDLSTGSLSRANANGTALGEYDDLAITLDASDVFYVIGCEDTSDTLQYVRVPPSFTGFAADVETAGVSAADCAVSVHGGEGHVYTSESGAIWDYAFDPASSDPEFLGVEYDSTYAPLDLEVPYLWNTRTIVLADAATDSIVLIDDTGVTMVADGEVPSEVDASIASDGTIYLAYLLPGGQAAIAWGTVAGGFTEVELDIDFTVTDVAVWATDDHVLYAATGADNVAYGAVNRE